MEYSSCFTISLCLCSSPGCGRPCLISHDDFLLHCCPWVQHAMNILPSQAYSSFFWLVPYFFKPSFLWLCIHCPDVVLVWHTFTYLQCTKAAVQCCFGRREDGGRRGPRKKDRMLGLSSGGRVGSPGQPSRRLRRPSRRRRHPDSGARFGRRRPQIRG